MNTLADVFRELNALQSAGVVRHYAVGGAMAVLFYAEPIRTYDVDVFVIVPGTERQSLAPLETIYEWTSARGFQPDAEHVVIHGVPVQFLPAYSVLVEEAVLRARREDYDGVPVRVVGPEHLVALAIQPAARDVASEHGSCWNQARSIRARWTTFSAATGWSVRMAERVSTNGETPQAIVDGKAAWHRRQAQMPLNEKVRILLELQRQDLVLIQRHRPLRSWERPWPIEP